jgi:hypothetical protein
MLPWAIETPDWSGTWGRMIGGKRFRTCNARRHRGGAPRFGVAVLVTAPTSGNSKMNESSGNGGTERTGGCRKLKYD